MQVFNFRSNCIASYTGKQLFLSFSQFLGVFTANCNTVKQLYASTKPFSPNQLRQMIDCVLRKYGHKPKYPKVKYYGPSDYKPITGTVVTPEQSLAVPNGLQNAIYNAFQTLKPLVGPETCSEEDAKQILSLKGQIQAARNIEEGKFPEIGRLTNQIKVPDVQSASNQKRQIRRHNKKIRIKQRAATK